MIEPITPGPWESLDDCVRVSRPESDFHHIEVCVVPYFLPHQKQNAIAIASVPDLVEAAMSTLIGLENGKGSIPFMITMLRAALRKGGRIE